MSSKSLAISVRDVSKIYQITSSRNKLSTIGETLSQRIRNPLSRPKSETFSALKDVSFDVERGDVLGVVGRNGAGKSTLLKVLSRITAPTSGEIRMYGRVGSLLEVGTGFHPELTGRENIFLNGAILGMRKQEIERQFDAIVEFSEVAKFLETPVKRYSSGMYVRLAFAVAAHLNPEILIVDEVLAVGDAQFQQKCIGKMKDVAQGEGKTVLFVSHNMAAVQTLCNKVAFFASGQLKTIGDVDTGIAAYAADRAQRDTILSSAKVLNPGITIDEILCNGSSRNEIELGPDQTSLNFTLSGRAESRLRANVDFILRDVNEAPLGYFSEGMILGESPVVEEGPFTWDVTLHLPKGMNAGIYSLSIEIAHQGTRVWVRCDQAVHITSYGTPSKTGQVAQYRDRGLLLMDGEVARNDVQYSSVSLP